MKVDNECAPVEERPRRNKSTAARSSRQDAMHAARLPALSISALQQLQAAAGNAAVSRLLVQRAAVRKGIALPKGGPGVEPLPSSAGVAAPGAAARREWPRLDPRFGSTNTAEKNRIGGIPPPATWESEAARDATADLPEHGSGFLQAGHNAPTEALIPVASHMVLRQPEGSKKSTPQTAEGKKRSELLTEFTDGAGLPEQQVSQIASAMRAFSLRQLQAMRKAGVRFWAPDSLPPEFKDNVQVKNLSTPGQYLDTLRIIRIAKNATTDAIRHEMAHAWDHVRVGKVKPIGKLKGKDFERALEDTPPFSSETKEKRATKETHEGKARSVRMTISEMFERYKKWPLREQCFDNPSTADSHSKASSKEFYAEGYSVFHSGSEYNQARLLYYAPELYELLEAEAKQQELGVPDRSKIEVALKEQNLQ